MTATAEPIPLGEQQRIAGVIAALLEEPARTRAIELLIAVDNGLPMHGLDAVRATDRLAQIILSELDVKRGAHDAPH